MSKCGSLNVGVFMACFVIGLLLVCADEVDQPSSQWTKSNGRRHRRPDKDAPMETFAYELEEEFGFSDKSLPRLLQNDDAMPIPIINVHPKSAMQAVELEFIYENDEFPDGFSVSLMNDPNGTAINCANSRNMHRIYDRCTPLNPITHHITCENLKPGLYCARAFELLPEGKNGRLFYTEMARLNEGDGTDVATLSESRQSDNDGYGTGKVLSICLGIGCSIVALILLGLLVQRNVQRKRSRRPVNPCNLDDGRSELIDAIRSKPAVRVYLMYYPECCHHVEFVEFLAKFLGNNNCQVSYDLKEVNSIAVNAASWINRKLSGRYKILVINSKSGFEQQKLWLDNAGVVIEDTASGEANIFLSALAMITHSAQQAFDYCTVYMLRPSYVSKHHLLRNICPGRQYEIPTELNHLLCDLHNINPQAVLVDAYPSEIWKHCAASYDVLLRQARNIAGTDAPTENGRFAANCHACSASAVATSNGVGNGVNERLLVT